MGAFANVVQLMAEMGVFKLFFPWLLMLSVVYGVLEKTEVFGDDSQVNGVIALSVAFISIGGAYFFLPEGILASLAAGLTFSVFGLLGLMILMAMTGYEFTEDNGMWDQPVLYGAVLGLLSIIGAFVFQADLSALTSGVSNAFQDIVMPILVLIFLLVVVAITAGGDGDE